MLEPIAIRRLPVVALAASGLILTACQGESEKTPPPPPATEPDAAPAPPPPPVLSRADLIQAAEAAASAYAAGGGPDRDSLSGRRFSVRQVFGCQGPAPVAAEDAPGDGLGRWSWGAERKTLRLSLTPGDWTQSALIAGGSADWEAVEGFWLNRPWLRVEGCPAGQGDPLASGPVAPSPQTVGLAAVHEQDSSRLGRRNGRAYSFVVRGEGDQPAVAPAGGYRLVLEGRLTAFADGRAFRCRASSPDQRPVCIAAAQIDRVAFEDAAGAVLSEWRPG